MKKDILCELIHIVTYIVIYCALTVPLLLYNITNGLWTDMLELIPWIAYVWFVSKTTNKICSWIL